MMKFLFITLFLFTPFLTGCADSFDTATLSCKSAGLEVGSSEYMDCTRNTYNQERQEKIEKNNELNSELNGGSF